MSYQQIRPSQFITTYGPGAILETRSGPVVIRSMDRLFTDRGLLPSDYAINDVRLTRDPRLNGSRIVRLPANAELGLEEKQPIYPTEGFPYWCLCVEHRILYQTRVGCPNCQGLLPRELQQKAGREAIRFVQACPEGHLDEIDWNYVVHGGSNCQANRGYYRWTGGGGSLRNINIECPQCPGRCNFGDVYSRDWRCTERYPELGGRPPQPNCPSRAEIIQRGAANLRLSVTVSALTIPPLTTRLHNVLQDIRILNACNTLRSINALNEQTFQSCLTSLNPPLRSSELQFIQSHTWAQIEAVLDQIYSNSQPAQRSLKEEEFDSLRFAAVQGVSVPSNQMVGPSHFFELRPSDVRIINGPQNQYQLRIAPIHRLRMVVAQLGYQRINAAARMVPVTFNADGISWVPGVELFGEGIFIDIPGPPLALEQQRADYWTRAFQLAPADETLHPIHVWWHTLSHRLIRALSVDSGYSSASIAERVFSSQDPDGVRRGGALLFTVQPGGDGTLGGLIGLVPRFERVLAAALADLNTCSNNPLCEDCVPDGINGSACYSCLLASETSCECRNIHLDRMLLLENLP